MDEFNEMTGAELHARYEEIVAAAKVILAKEKDDRTAAEKAQLAVYDEQLVAIRAAYATEDVEPDVSDLPEPVAEEVPAEEPAAEVPAVEVPAAPAPEPEPVMSDADVAAAAAAGHNGAAPPKASETPTDALPQRQPLVIASTGAHANVAGARDAVLRAGSGDGHETDWRVQVASAYSKARRGDKPVTEIWRSERYSSETQVLTRQCSALQGAEIMGLTGRADACNPRFIDEPQYCIAPESEAQAWIPKFAMDGEIEVKTRDPETSTAPTFFEWAYDEDFSGTRKTGLVVTGDVPAPYDPDNTATWKPVSALTTVCTENTWRLRGIGYIREIERGLDLADPAAVERAMRHDTAYLEQNKSTAIINAFDAYAAANNFEITMDATASDANGYPFNNPMSAFAYLFAEYRPAFEVNYGVDFGDATLFVPKNLGPTLGVARYESLADNNRYTVDEIATLAGVGDTVSTNAWAVTGGEGIDPTITEALDPTIATGFGRSRQVVFYISWRAGWRQGQGPGVRGVVTSDERNLRGNKRLMMVEDDLVNISFGCLSTIKFTVDVDILGGHTAGSAPYQVAVP